MGKSARWWWMGALLVLVSLRFAHLNILWIEEAYPTAAAQEVLRGKQLYKEIWFDKPPLYAWTYLLWGARTGFVLRLAGAVYVLLCAFAAYFAARGRWSEVEGRAAALFTAFFLTFGIPSAVMALAPDLMTVLPHLAAVALLWRGHPLAAGIAAGAGVLANTKAAILLPVLVVFQPRAWPLLLAGFAMPVLAAAAWLGANGALRFCWEQVFRWGALYAGDTFVANPMWEGLRRTANWFGFHAAVAGPALWMLSRRAQGFERIGFVLWMVLALTAVAAGWRFFPRYYFLLLIPMVLAAARGWALLPRRARWAAALLLLVPLIRFGPRYGQLGVDVAQSRQHHWDDLALYYQSREAAFWLKTVAKPGDSVLVWGYRSDIQVFSGLESASRFLDSQPLTGVMADRHLTQSTPTAAEWAARNRRELLHSLPTYIVDALGEFNPNLAPGRYADLADWFRHYRPIMRTGRCIIYRRMPVMD